MASIRLCSSYLALPAMNADVCRNRLQSHVPLQVTYPPLYCRTLDAFRGWGQYLRLALPSVAMQSVEQVAFQGMIVMAGYLTAPDTNVAAMGIALTLSGLALMVNSGIAGMHT